MFKVKWEGQLGSMLKIHFTIRDLYKIISHNLSAKVPNCLDIFQTVWKFSKLSGHFPDRLDIFQTKCELIFKPTLSDRFVFCAVDQRL